MRILVATTNCPHPTPTKAPRRHHNAGRWRFQHRNSPSPHRTQRGIRAPNAPGRRDRRSHCARDRGHHHGMERIPGGALDRPSVEAIRPGEQTASTGRATQDSAKYERLYNAATVSQWLQAETSGQKKLADLYERRFLPEFRPAFDAWKKTDPLNNPNAPPGPFHMPEFRSSNADVAAKLSEQASDTFEQGDAARHHADDYVRETVMLATVLLLTAISQRFKGPLCTDWADCCGWRPAVPFDLPHRY